MRVSVRVCATATALSILQMGLPVAAFADAESEARISALEQKLEHSLELIAELSARVKELEAQQGGASPSAPVDAHALVEASRTTMAASAATDQTLETQQRLSSVEQQVAQLSDSSANRGGGGIGVPLHGFADIGIGNHTADEPGLKGANVGALDIFLNPQLGEHTRSLFELTFEVDEEGQVEPDLERAQIGYQFSDAASIWIGRFHTPFGFYNTAFHHGQEIATSLRRPRMILFEDQGGILPNHTVGAWFTGAEHLAGGKVSYDLFIGNAQKIIEGEIDPRSGGVDNGRAIFGANLGYVFSEQLSGLKIGVSGFRSDIGDDIESGRVTRVVNGAIYFDYDTERFEHIGELYRFSDRSLTDGGGTHKSTAGFLQLAMRWPFVTPYVRYERAALDQRDTYFKLQNNGSSYFREALGVRFDLDSKSALKLELAHTKNTDRLMQQWNDALLDYAIRF